MRRLVLALTLGACAPAPSSQALAPCVGTVITVRAGERPGCDVQRPQRLDVLGASRSACDRMGGAYRPLRRLCAGVDY